MGAAAAHRRRNQDDHEGRHHPGPGRQGALHYRPGPVCDHGPVRLWLRFRSARPSCWLGYKIDMSIADVNVGLLYTLAILSLNVYGIVLGGWASGNKYSFLGGMRSTAQMISYELAMGMSIIGVVLLGGSLNLKADCRGADRRSHLPSCSRSDFSSSSSVCLPIPTALPSICPRRRRSWSPATTPSTRASSMPSSTWPSTSTW